MAKQQFFKLLTLALVLTTLAARADVTINNTNFPDANFRSYLLSEYPSGTITTAQLNARTELELGSMNISNLKGIEYFTQLTRLHCFNNNLTTVDLGSNTKLTYLNLGYNKLTSINVTANTELEQLYLQYNQLTSVNVSSHSKLYLLWIIDNPNLTGLYCWRNNLTNLRVDGCTALLYLKCYNNYNLTEITGLADCTNLTYLDCEDCAITDISAVSNMPNLETLLAQNNQLTTLTVNGKSKLTKLRVLGNKQLTTLSCSSCNLNSLNVKGCTALTDLRCYYNYELTEITGLADCTALTYLDCEDCAITSLPGVNNMSNLQTLWARNNQLTGDLTVSDKPNLQRLRVKGNPGLTYLSCRNNALTSLDVTGCTGLEYLGCESNSNLTTITGLSDCTALEWFGCDYCAITSLDMTFCPGISSLYCYNNQLTSLNVTGLTELIILNCKDNPNLEDITGLTDCTALNYLECSRCALSTLELSNFSDLTELWCSGNQFSSLMGSNLSNLKTLVANDNPLLAELEFEGCALTQLYVYNCPKLYYLDCIGNLLEQCEDGLQSLDCRYNQITGTLDVGRFTDLHELAISNNEYSSLQNVANHTELTLLYCANNHLTSLDASGCSALKSLQAQTNQITSLNVSDCPALSLLAIFYNQINSFHMGQIVNGMNTRPASDRGLFYVWVYDPSDPDWNVITTAQVEQAESKYWDVYAWLGDGSGWSPYAGTIFERWPNDGAKAPTMTAHPSPNAHSPFELPEPVLNKPIVKRAMLAD